jgi:hypothetical protein
LLDGTTPIPTSSLRHTETSIDGEFARRPDLNVGILMGPTSGIIAIEETDDRSEQDALELFDGWFPVTPTFLSESGPHRLFRWNERLQELERPVLRFGSLYVRLGGGGMANYVILPPSTVNDYRREWVLTLDDCDGMFAELPDDVVDRLIETRKPCSRRDARDLAVSRR